MIRRECSGNRFVTSGMPLALIIRWSYDVSPGQIVGLPSWTSDREHAYDIDARASQSMTQAQCKQMVQDLIVRRFNMTVRREQREMRAYALTVAKGGPKMRAAMPDEAGGVRFNGAFFRPPSNEEAPGGIGMGAFATYLGGLPAVGQPVIDRTGLHGAYSFDLNFSIRDKDDLPSIWTAVQEQLGLKLEAVRAPIELLIIDHIEKANAN